MIVITTEYIDATGMNPNRRSYRQTSNHKVYRGRHNPEGNDRGQHNPEGLERGQHNPEGLRTAAHAVAARGRLGAYEGRWRAF